jgi:DNA-binding XRE family transcriptional regulator
MNSHTPKPNELLLRARMERGFSQPDLAKRLGVSLKQVWRWENGLAQPRPYCRRLLSHVLHKTAVELGFDTERISPTSLKVSPPSSPVFLNLPPAPPRHLLVGRDQDLDTVRQWVLGGNSVILTGLPGVGKTTLASILAHDPALHNSFQDGILWAELGRKPDVLAILTSWSQVPGISPHQVVREGKPALQAAIGDRAMCLILDDVWDSADALQLQVGGPRCVYIYTSRFPRVAAELSGGMCRSYPLRELTEEQGVSLLQLLAPQAVDIEPERTRELASAVGGLPLALHLVGRALNRQSTTGQARRVQAAFDRLSNAPERLRLPIASHPSAQGQPAVAAPSLGTSLIGTAEDLLDEQARSALDALSILPAKPATFSEAAALATARCTVETLDLLCDLGFLECCGSDRYHMHQIIADCGRHRLDPASREGALLGLMRYVLELVETAAHDSPRLDEDTQTILIALEAASTREMRQEFIQILGGVAPFFLRQGQLALIERHLRHASSLAKQAQDGILHPKLLERVPKMAGGSKEMMIWPRSA